MPAWRGVGGLWTYIDINPLHFCYFMQLSYVSFLMMNNKAQSLYSVIIIDELKKLYNMQMEKISLSSFA